MPLINITGAIGNEYLSVAFLFMFFVITMYYASSKVSSNFEAFTQSSQLTSLVSMLMYGMDVISWKYAFIPVVMSLIGVVAAKESDKEIVDGSQSVAKTMQATSKTEKDDFSYLGVVAAVLTALIVFVIIQRLTLCH